MANIDKIILNGTQYDLPSGGSSYTAGEGIDITNDVISADTDNQNEVIASALVELHNDKADRTQLNNYQPKGNYTTTEQVDATVQSYARSETEAISVEKVDAAALNDLDERVTTLEQGGSGGGITGITMNGSSVTVTSGVADLGTVVTDKSDKQDVLVSGTNIKTINNESILGSGNITIGSGSSYTAGEGIDITNSVITNTREQRVLTFEDRTYGVNAAVKIVSPHWAYTENEIEDPASNMVFFNNVPSENANPYVQSNFLDGTLMEFEITSYHEDSSSSFRFEPDSVTGGKMYVYYNGQWEDEEGYGMIYTYDYFAEGQKYRMNQACLNAFIAAMQADCPYDSMDVKVKNYAWSTDKSASAVHSGTAYPLVYETDFTALAARVTALEAALGNISSSLDTINGEVV